MAATRLAISSSRPRLPGGFVNDNCCASAFAIHSRSTRRIGGSRDRMSSTGNAHLLDPPTNRLHESLVVSPGPNGHSDESPVRHAVERSAIADDDVIPVNQLRSQV